MSALVAAPARAAEDDTADVRGLDVSRFPQVQFYLSLANYLGAQPDPLLPSDLVIREDGNPVSSFTVQEEITGYRLIVVYSSGSDGHLVLPSGERRADAVRRVVAEWVSSQTDGTKNDYSFMRADGSAIRHSSDPGTILNSLQMEQPASSTGGRTVQAMLSDSINIAADPIQTSGMRTIVMLITDGAPRSEDQAICPRARAMGMLVYGFWIGEDDFTSMDALNTWTASCAGYSGFMANEPGLRSLLTGMLSQKKQYHVTYRSKLSQSGDHSLSVSIQQDRFQAETPSHAISLQVVSPTVALSNLPETIRRSGAVPLQSAEEFMPQEMDLEVSVAFPDGHLRNIESVQLYVDGKQVSECNALPCPGLRWDLRPYADSGTHSVRVSVKDELGLVGESPEQSILIAVEYPSTADLFWAKYSGALFFVSGLTGLFGLVVVLPRLLRRRPRRRTSKRMDEESESIPSFGLRELVHVLRLRWTRWRAGEPPPPQPPDLMLQPTQGLRSAIPLVNKDVVIGSSPEESDVVISDPSLSPRHACISRNADGKWWVVDLDSAAGTWIQWEEIPECGAPLRVGDILHLGRVAFRVEYPISVLTIE